MFYTFVRTDDDDNDSYNKNNNENNIASFRCYPIKMNQLTEDFS